VAQKKWTISFYCQRRGYHEQTENFYNMSTVHEALSKMLFSMSTLRRINGSQSFLKLSSCPISQIRQTETCLSMSSWMTSQRIFNRNSITENINSLSSPVPISGIYILQDCWAIIHVNYVHRLHRGPLFSVPLCIVMHAAVMKYSCWHSCFSVNLQCKVIVLSC